jgi:hypothetical protein
METIRRCSTLRAASSPPTLRQGIYLKDSDTFLEEINPGNTLNGTVVFDIPKKAKPDYLLLKSGVWGFDECVEVEV